ncbi:hypothetical protein [Micromonospora costi]|uniref:Uncharacterized protein n=1 Tax=Micromonospora costi TaxID=1530042 RepID=A0A3B0AAB1_9ACTN|nr:hypothetical protein [Micromonospora costi]RKN55997.1 hypothetical protein D7193_15545 [Micromonospora costi]
MTGATTRTVTVDSTPAEIDGRLIELWMTYAHHRAIAESDRLSDDVRDAANQAAREAAEEAEPLEAAYRERQWPRWWWVPNGHLHREGDCSTLYASTERNLTAAASGMDDAQVVKRYGWHVCAVCVPNAPVLDGFRTPGTYAAAEAAANGDCLNKVPTYVNNRGWTAWGGCGECGARGVAVTSLGNLRKHKHQRMADDAARKARIDDPRLIGTPTGEVLKVDRSEIKTKRTAEIEWVRYMEYVGLGWTGDDYRTFARQIAEALAAKDGVTVEDVEARLQLKVDKKLRQIARPATR